MAIKNMDNIYRRAKRIIAVPDLCYDSKNPQAGHLHREGVELSVEEMSLGEIKRNVDAPLDALHAGRTWKLTRIEFIRKVIHEWACRCWVISERTIGVKHDKLDVIILRENGAKIAYLQWSTRLYIDWDIDFDQDTLIKTIISSESTKCIDRLFAILPHTKYKDAVQQLVDEGQKVDDMRDLKLTLFNILDIEGKILLLQQIALDYGDFRHVLPSFTEDEVIPLSKLDYANQTYCCNIQTTTQDGKPAIKVSGPYTINSRRISSTKSDKLLGTKVNAVVDILLVKKELGYFNLMYQSLRCFESNGIWVLGSVVDKRVPQSGRFNYGEFTIV
ncbi:hypothetical protein EC973_002956 [Apophysomyces ossiformis]|uniref:Uncharacterized protein n=1 Tax=Apophysomyces ossiformis TaxID=679940 RepID=A0A8H7BN14_9FUNG|nr:hypothetical protein EC973_002956 [Apophysomyces ossiformis]